MIATDLFQLQSQYSFKKSVTVALTLSILILSYTAIILTELLCKMELHVHCIFFSLVRKLQHARLTFHANIVKTVKLLHCQPQISFLRFLPAFTSAYDPLRQLI